MATTREAKPLPRLGFAEADEIDRAWFGELDFSNMAAAISMDVPMDDHYSSSSASFTPGSSDSSSPGRMSSGSPSGSSSSSGGSDETAFSHISLDGNGSLSGESAATGVAVEHAFRARPRDPPASGAGGTKRVRRSYSPDLMRGAGPSP